LRGGEKMKKALIVILIVFLLPLVWGKEKKETKPKDDSILYIGDNIEYDVVKKELVKGDKDEAIDILVREYVLLQQIHLQEVAKSQRLVKRYMDLVDKIIKLMSDEIKEAQQ